jgi:hypothetical protein
MLIVKADKNSEAGVLPDEKMLSEMGKFNQEMIDAGILLAGEGLQPSSKGARVKFSGDKRTVTDGPFAETKELVAGFWIIRDRMGQTLSQSDARYGIGDRDSSNIRIGRFSKCATRSQETGNTISQKELLTSHLVMIR